MASMTSKSRNWLTHNLTVVNCREAQLWTRPRVGAPAVRWGCNHHGTVPFESK
jgi:hypothetical protein